MLKQISRVTCFIGTIVCQCLRVVVELSIMGYIVNANNKDHITFEGGTMELKCNIDPGNYSRSPKQPRQGKTS